MKRLRLVKVLVQPVFVIDDGVNVEEIEHPAIAIPAADWPTYSGERFPAEAAQWEALLNAEEAPPNRAARRAKKPKTKPARAG